MSDQTAGFQAIQFAISIISLFKNKLADIIKKINTNKNSDAPCREIISKHYDTINGLISKLDEANKDEFEKYYNVILVLEQTIVQLAQKCF